MQFLSRRSTRVLYAAAAALSLAACSDDPVSPVNEGRIRAVNAVSNVTGLDVLLNSTNYKTNLAYKATDGYKAIGVGATAVKFRKNGVATDLQSISATIANAVDYTAIALGTEAAPQSFVLVDSNSAPAAGKVKLRVVHAAASIGALDVYILANANDLANATAAKTNLVVKSASEYLVKDAGTYVVIFTQAGTKTALLTINGVQTTAGNIRTLIAVEKAGGGSPLEGVVLSDK